MIVFINPTAGSDTALKKWKGIVPALHSSGTPLRTHMLNGQPSIQEEILNCLRAGETDFVAAGGDGTVNALLNALLSVSSGDQIRNIRLGAIGLGSSNDFHKPFIPDQLIDNIPYKTNFNQSLPRDVGCVSYEENGTPTTKYFLINASVGITAEANHFFNNPDMILRPLKRFHTPSAILYAAIKTILTFRNFQVRLHDDELGEFASNVTNLGIVKNSHFSGNLSYDGPISYDNGKLTVHLSFDMGRIEVLRLMEALSHGKFSSIKNTRSWLTPSITVSASHPFTVEFDGEIIATNSAKFSVLPKHIKVCP